MSVFFEAVWLVQRVGGCDRVSLKQEGLPEGRQDWEFCTMMEADFTRLGRACSGVFGLWGSFRGLVVLGSCSTECSMSRGLEWLAGLLRTQEALPLGSPTQKDCLRM